VLGKKTAVRSCALPRARIGRLCFYYYSFYFSAAPARRRPPLKCPALLAASAISTAAKQGGKHGARANKKLRKVKLIIPTPLADTQPLLFRLVFYWHPQMYTTINKNNQTTSTKCQYAIPDSNPTWCKEVE